MRRVAKLAKGFLQLVLSPSFFASLLALLNSLFYWDGVDLFSSYTVLLVCSFG